MHQKGKTDPEIELSVVVLCYRSGESIRSFARQLKSAIATLSIPFEIILVGNYDEGATDDTPSIVRSLAENDHTFKALTQPKLGMMGWDVKEGLKITTGKVICYVDGDGQFPIQSIVDCYRMLIHTNADLVKTYRIQREDGWRRKLFSSFFNQLFRFLFPTNRSRDINSKPKMFDRKVYDALDLVSDDWFIDAEVMIKADKLGLVVSELPIVFHELEGRNSFVNMGTAVEFIINLLRFRIKTPVN
jgi:glycosyltransferase involved in cell wall biosynthesis